MARFEHSASAGTIYVPATPAVQFADHRYQTPSGKIEIAGERYVAAGLPSAQPLAEEASRTVPAAFSASEWL